MQIFCMLMNTIFEAFLKLSNEIIDRIDSKYRLAPKIDEINKNIFSYY